MEIVKGRPLNVKERLKKEVRVYDLLDELDIEYWRIDHEVAQTMEDCEEVDRILDAVICKNLFLCNRQKTKFYLLMIQKLRCNFWWMRMYWRENTLDAIHVSIHPV